VQLRQRAEFAFGRSASSSTNHTRSFTSRAMGSSPTSNVSGNSVRNASFYKNSYGVIQAKTNHRGIESNG
jgi:hypothetical protein